MYFCIKIMNHGVYCKIESAEYGGSVYNEVKNNASVPFCNRPRNFRKNSSKYKAPCARIPNSYILISYFVDRASRRNAS